MMEKLAADYTRMSAMIFGDPPAFDAVIVSVKELEQFLNVDVALRRG
jgi:hypothetical protein